MSLALGLIAKTTIVLLVAGLVSVLMRRASASRRHSVWALGIVSVMAVTAASFAPPLEVPLHIPRVQAALPERLQLSFSRPSDIVPESPSLVWQTTADEESRAWRNTSLLVGAWVIGSIFFLTRFAFDARAVRRLLQNSAADPDGSLRQIVNELSRVLSIRRRVRLAFTDRRISPMTWGIFRCAIILPSNSLLWTEERQRAVMAHELAHVKRKDGVFQFLAQAACSLYWFNPLMWHAFRILRTEREHACDDRVLKLGIAPEDYATHLVEIARGLGSPEYSSVIGSIGVGGPASSEEAAKRCTDLNWTVGPTLINGERSRLETRLVSILDPHVSRRPLSGFGASALSSAALLIVALAMVRPLITPAMPSAASVMAARFEIQNPSGELTRPQLNAFSQPAYTVEAFQSFVEGAVTLQTIVSSDGSVKDARVVKGLGYGLDESALAAVRSWKFSPALRNGEPVEATMELAVEFKLARAAVRLGPGIAPPTIVSRIEPAMTEAARTAGARGTVILEAIIRLDGTVEISRVIQPLGYGLTESAIQALREWTFQPATKDGARLPVLTNISVVFDWR